MTVVIADSVADSVQEDKKHTKRNMDKNNGKLNPRHSMSVIYAYIGVVLGVNVSTYGMCIHGVSGHVSTKLSQNWYPKPPNTSLLEKKTLPGGLKTVKDCANVIWLV